MTEILRVLRLEAGQAEVLSLWEVVVALVLTLACSLLIGWVYRFTHRSLSYSQSYVQTLVLTSMVTCLIMLVIGSNIARAFSLVGALSIIRFRNAVKETRDVGYIFFAMAVAMACGTRFYAAAVVATGIIAATMVLLNATNYASTDIEPERLLRVRIPADRDPAATLEETFQRLFRSYSLVLVESARQGANLDAVYSVRPKPGLEVSQIVAEISKVNGNDKVTYHFGLHTDDL